MHDRYGDEPLDVPDHEWDAHTRALAVVNCELCDDDGYRGCVICDHVDYRPAAKRGMALIREVLNRKPGVS